MASTDWNSDFLDLIDCLTEHSVDFLIVGAFALAQHGVPRATGDIDVLVRPSPENATRVFAALARFGAPLDSASVTAADFAKPGTVYQVGLVPRRVDILTEISGVPFEQAWEGRVTRAVDGRSVPFLGLEALLQNKRATGRPKDLLDAAALERLGGHSRQ